MSAAVIAPASVADAAPAPVAAAPGPPPFPGGGGGDKKRPSSLKIRYISKKITLKT